MGGAKLRTLRLDDIAAVYSCHRSLRPQPSRELILSHEHVVEAMMARGPVLPLRFGTQFERPEHLTAALEERREEIHRQEEEARREAEEKARQREEAVRQAAVKSLYTLRLALDVSDDHLGLLLHELQSKDEAAAPTGRVIGILAASGGCGASTLAVNLATVLAREHERCALLDHVVSEVHSSTENVRRGS